MPTMTHQLAEMAEQIADSLEAQAASIEYQLTQLDAEQLKLNTRKSQLLSARDGARDARQRLANYSGSGCPYCWIIDHQTASLRSIGGGTDMTDMFRCTRCDRTIEVDF